MPPGRRDTLSLVVTPARVHSLNVGHGQPNAHKRLPQTGIEKHPVGSFEVRDPGPKHGGLGSGVVGDVVGDQRHHGGVTQAVYAYPLEDLQWWSEQVGRTLTPGGFGENITTVGVDTTHAIVGETWRIGEVVLRVEVPRLPCATFAGHMGERAWVKRFTAAGRTGAYLSVVVPGTIVSEAGIEVDRPGHDIDLLSVFRAVTGDLESARRVLDSGVLHPTEQDYLAVVVARRTNA